MNMEGRGLMKKSIDIKEKVCINGIDQKIHIVGTDMNNPVVLFIHGGPGVVDRHNVVNKLSGITDRLTLVGWDQRGTGGSYKGVTEKDMTVSAIVDDAKKMVEYLCEKFNKEKIYIEGHSWGSCVGTLLVSKYPENIAAYFGQGQLVNGVRNEEVSYDYTLQKAEQADNAKDIAKLKSIGRPVKGFYENDPYKGLTVQRRLLMKYGGGVAKRSTMFKSIAIPIMFSGEYSLPDLFGLVKGSMFTIKTIGPQMIDLDFTEKYKKFDIPMFYLIGAHDYTTPNTLAKEYYNMVEAPIKDLIWFENSAHYPLFEEPEKFARVLVEKIYQIEGM